MDQEISFKEARIKVSAGQCSDVITVRNYQDTMYSGGRNLSDITGSNQNALNKLKSRSNFLSLSQLMNSSLPNNNRYSHLIYKAHKMKMKQQKMTVTWKRNRPMTLLQPEKMKIQLIVKVPSLKGSDSRKYNTKGKNIQFVKKTISTTTWRLELIQWVNHNVSIPCMEKLTSENL